MIRIKAANQQIKNELKSMQDQTNALDGQIQFIKDQKRSDTKNVSDIMEVVKYITFEIKERKKKFIKNYFRHERNGKPNHCWQLILLLIQQC